MTACLAPALRAAAMRWIADDVDAGDRAELQRVLASALAGDAAAVEELATRMAGPLRFGTAGLRGPLRAGPAGMNRAVMLRTSAALASWLAGQGRAGTVVIGRDARHRSEEFAADAAGVFGAAGFDTVALPRPLPTPVLAFAARRLGAVAGVQITASHNPPGDNGYKVYTDGGTQIAPPADIAIEAAIAAAPPAVAVRRDGPVRGRRRAGGLPATGGRSSPRDRSRRAGGGNAADALLALAAELEADLAIALDPDADRCALGAPDREGRWRMLRGDETGVLLAEHLLATLDQPNPLVATSIVSSSLLRQVAVAHGAQYAETRTGFKWLMRAGDGLVYAYEEALGYCVDPEAVRDKDGISAAVLACDLAATAQAAGHTLDDLLDSLAIRHGVYRTDQVSIRLPDNAAVAEAMAQLRARPPADLDGYPVQAQDLLHHPQQPDNTLALRGGGFRVMVRPSGTEPKLKAYLEVVAPVPAPDQLATAQDTARQRLATLSEATSAALSDSTVPPPPSSTAR